MLKSAHPDELFCLLGFIIWFSGSVMQLQMGFLLTYWPTRATGCHLGCNRCAACCPSEAHTHNTALLFVDRMCEILLQLSYDKCYQIFGSALNYHYYYYHDIFLPVVTSYQTWNQPEPCRHTLLSPLSPPWEKSVTSPLCVITSKFS